MSKRYAIWDKQTPIITPIYEVLTAEQWMARYPAASLDTVTVICSAGEVNGAFFGTLNQMVSMYEKQGADFSQCASDEEKLAVIEAFEDAREAEAEEAAQAAQAAAEQEADNAERQTAALEAIASGQTIENAAALDALLNGGE